MSKVLVYTSPARGHLYPITPTLDELHRRGHRVAVRTLASQVELMRSRGFDAAPIAPALEEIEHDDYTARSPQGALKRGLAVFARRAGHEVPDLRAAIADERPDLVLVDGQAWGGLAAAEEWGGPWGSWLPYPMPLPSPDVPPFGPGLPPARGPARADARQGAEATAGGVVGAGHAAPAQRGAHRHRARAPGRARPGCSPGPR